MYIAGLLQVYKRYTLVR